MIIRVMSPKDTRHDVNLIVNTLSTTDRKNFGVLESQPYQSDLDSYRIYHREILYDEYNSPIAFFDVYSTGERPAIAICVRSDMQNVGCGRIVAFFGMHWVRQHLSELNMVEWTTKSTNFVSQHLAKRFGFARYSYDHHSQIITYTIKSS